MNAQSIARQSLFHLKKVHQSLCLLGKGSGQARKPSSQGTQPHAKAFLSSSGGGASGVQNESTHKLDQAALSRESTDLQPGLYLVATPIGNLEDITLRALRVLRSASAILAEDTRHSQKLLNFHDIKTRTFSFHEHNEREKEGKVLEMLQAGQAVALISDAGVPLISDPGSGLVSRAAEEGIRIIPIPGPSAVTSALVASGLPTSQFRFCGFLPPKQVARQKAITALSETAASLVFFVPPHSLNAVLADLAAILGGARRCAVARELTKVYEEFYRASLDEAAAEFGRRTPKGEITLVVEGVQKGSTALSDADIKLQLQSLVAEGMSASSAAKRLSQELQLPKNRVYDLAVQNRQSDCN